MATDLKDSNLYFLTIQTIYKNQFITSKNGIVRNKAKTKVVKIKA